MYREPLNEEILEYSKKMNRNYDTDYYSLREELRTLFNGPTPKPSRSWGDYWKSYS